MDEYDLRDVHPCMRGMFHKLSISERMTLRPISNKENIIGLNLADCYYTYAFKIRIPYAISKILKWDIIFNPHDLTFAPDFYFNDKYFDEFLQKFHADDLYEYVPDWFNWNVNNSESLKSVVGGFILLYKEFQEDKIRMAKSFLLEEYRSIASLENYTSGDTELYVEDDSAEFLIALHVQISQLPAYIQQDDGGIFAYDQKDYILLGVLFHDLEGKIKTVQLHLSLNLDHFLGKRKNINIPPYTKPIAQYIPFTTSLLQRYIDNMTLFLQFKRQFIASLVALKWKCILEYDSFHFNYIVLLFEVYGIYIHVKVQIGDFFPFEESQVKVKIAHPLGSIDHQMSFGFKQTSQRTPNGLAISFLDQLKMFLSNSLRAVAN